MFQVKPILLQCLQFYNVFTNVKNFFWMYYLLSTSGILWTNILENGSFLLYPTIIIHDSAPRLFLAKYFSQYI